jgi:glycosyltransferase involved in cell wall biosynthesis
MRLSVVLITFERPRALQLALRGLARQTEPAYEVIVTDDGSRDETRAVVEREAVGFPSRLVFLTQPRRGPRMSQARNRGIAAARGEYVVFLDGDLVPERHLIADHRAFARRGSFAQGSRVLAGQAVTERLLATGELEVGPFEPGLSRRRHAVRAPFLWWLFSRRHRSRRGLKSCNLAFFRDDLLRLNGFNESMTGWGLEDGELCARAYHLGLWRRDIRLGAAATHLWHGPPAELSADNPNWGIYRETLASGLVRCERGLDAHLAALDPPPPDLRP